ncbi:MAG: cupin domain-containing protein [Pseudomonadota bacterium]|nr:cupin domain-containing protein [Pseudomonadota bacterium]
MGAPIVINIAEKLSAFADHWNPRVVAGYNGNELRVAKIEGDFTWHSHADSDELFLVMQGEIGIEFRDGMRRLKAGEIIVVPRGIEHRPFAEAEAHILLIDREGEPNTGANPSHLTRDKLDAL